MRALLPYLALYKRHKWMLSLGIVLAIVTLLASIGLLTLPAGSSRPQRLRGLPDCTASTICYPLRHAWRSNHPYCRRYFERLVSHDATFRVLQHLRIYTFSKLLPLPCRTGALSSGRIAQSRGGGC